MLLQMITILTLYTVQQPEFKPLEPYLKAESETEVVRILRENEASDTEANEIYTMGAKYADHVYERDIVNENKEMNDLEPLGVQLDLIKTGIDEYLEKNGITIEENENVGKQFQRRRYRNQIGSYLGVFFERLIRLNGRYFRYTWLRLSLEFC